MRKLFLITIGYLLCACVSGCSMFCDYQILPSGHYWPKQPQWTVVPATNSAFSAHSSLDFRAVYVRKSSVTWCHVYRFWPSGRAIFKNMPYPPSLEGIENHGGWSLLGYYEIEASNLVVEIYGPAGSPGNKGGYSKDVFLITDSALIQQSATFNGHNFNDFTKYDMNYRRYDKYPIDKMQSEPFW